MAVVKGQAIRRREGGAAPNTLVMARSTALSVRTRRMTVPEGGRRTVHDVHVGDQRMGSVTRSPTSRSYYSMPDQSADPHAPTRLHPTKTDAVSYLAALAHGTYVR